jgi:transcriptional regulator with XRE-family HTH domain
MDDLNIQLRFGAYIQKIRGDKSQRALAELVDLSQSAISDYEAGKRRPDICALEKVARYEKIPPERLLARLYDREFKPSAKPIPVEEQIETMSLAELVALNEAIAVRLRRQISGS